MLSRPRLLALVALGTLLSSGAIAACGGAPAAQVRRQPQPREQVQIVAVLLPVRDTGFRVSYVGTATRKTEYAYNINQPVADSRPFVSKPRLFPQYPNFDYVTNGAGHDYNALTVEAMRSMAKGLYFQASY